MRRLLPLLLAALFVPALAAGTGDGGPHRLTVLFTNDVHGYVEPCG